MKKEDRTNIKISILFLLIIAIFTISIVPRGFQNDTFFNISIGKYILENGIDMQEHFSWVSGLTYTYSHWAFDVLIYLIYSKFNFMGIYVFTIIFSICINATIYILINKSSKNSIVSLFITLMVAFLNSHNYTARSQIVSFLCFIIEYYCIEKFVETDNKKYGIIIFILGIIIANFHAATWPLMFILFLPHIGAAFFNFFSSKNIYTKLKQKSEKKLEKISVDSPKYSKILEDIEIYNKIISKENQKQSYKIEKKSNYNLKHLIILMIITIFSGLITPIKDVPFTYIIKSMFGHSNFGNAKSIAYISEMQHFIPIGHASFLIFIVILVEFLIFLPSKLKLEHGFLILGLLIMTLSSNRYLALLIFIGSFVLSDLITQCFTIYVAENIYPVEVFLTSPVVALILVIVTSAYSISTIIENKNIDFVNEKLYPIEATNYILENIDYQNMRIYNSYNFGSYLMLNNIPVFIDSRLDVYCSEFNNTDVFHNYIDIVSDLEYYEDVFSKYDFTHILLKNDEVILKYLKRDTNYTILYEDEYFTLFERNIANPE